jgi:hypothetical protein
MQGVLDDFFANLLGSNIQRPYSLNLAACHRDAIDLSSLEAPFSVKEVCDTIGALPSDKAPGPDGFTGKFYKCCWHIMSCTASPTPGDVAPATYAGQPSMQHRRRLPKPISR